MKTQTVPLHGGTWDSAIDWAAAHSNYSNKIGNGTFANVDAMCWKSLISIPTDSFSNVPMRYSKEDGVNSSDPHPHYSPATEIVAVVVKDGDSNLSSTYPLFEKIREENANQQMIGDGLLIAAIAFMIIFKNKIWN